MDIQPTLIRGDFFSDDRGKLSFINNFLMSQVKRMYMVEHPDPTVIRAWQAHKREQKWFYVLDGAFLVKLIKIDNWEMPFKAEDCIEFNLSRMDNTILHVPGGYANGFKGLFENSRLLVFSDLDIKEAAEDNMKFRVDYWNCW